MLEASRESNARQEDSVGEAFMELRGCISTDSSPCDEFEVNIKEWPHRSPGRYASSWFVFVHIF